MKTETPTPAELVDQVLGELEAQLVARFENEYGGQEALAELRAKRNELAEHLKDARWRRRGLAAQAELSALSAVE